MLQHHLLLLSVSPMRLRVDNYARFLCGDLDRTSCASVSTFTSTKAWHYSYLPSTALAFEWQKIKLMTECHLAVCANRFYVSD